MAARAQRAEIRTLREDEAIDQVRAEIERYRRDGDLGDGTYIEPRCRVCKDQPTRQSVNRMLAYGLTYQEILQTLAPYNATAAKNHKITYRSLWTHTKQHYRIHEPAKAVYRDIVERRALQEGKDVVEGVANLINTYSYLETMMVKGFQSLTDEEVPVSPVEGMNAALRLREVTREDSSSHRMSDMMHQMDRIIAAIKEVVPDRYHAAILARLDGTEGVMDVEAVDAPDLQEIPLIDPGHDHDERDELEDD